MDFNDETFNIFQPIISYHNEIPRWFNLISTRRYIYWEKDVNTRPPTNDGKSVVYYDEQQFVRTAIKKWVNVNQKKATEILPEVLNEVNRLWNLKRDKVFFYPELYKNCGHVSLAIDKTPTSGIRFERLKILKINGYQPVIKLPLGAKSDSFDKGAEKSKRNIATITEHLPFTLKEKYQYPTVSDDMLAQELAQQKNINIVISCSGLRTLLDNNESVQCSDWTLPFCVKDITCTDGTKKQVLFIDKALPRPYMSRMEQKNWHGKSAANSFLKFNGALNEDIKCLKNSEPKKVKLEEEHKRTNSRFKLEIGTFFTSQDTKSGTKAVRIVKKDRENTKIVKTSYSYELWKLESFSDKNVLLKNAKKDFNIIVRNKQPCKSLAESQAYCISSKLEYQPEFGGEQMSLSQLIREWVLLLLNPESKLLRVRADGNTLNYISHDLSDIILIERNIKHLYNVLVRSQLHLLHNVFNYLADLPRGQYLLCRRFNDGMFASVFKATESEGNFNLHENFSELKTKEQNLPWIPIDYALITPTFRRTPQTLKKKKKKKKKNTRKQRTQV